MKAVVDIRGKIIVPPQYKSIEFLDLGSYPFFGDRDIIFTCTKENGTVHIASAGDAPRRLMYAYLGAIVLEIVIYAVVWRILL